MGKNNYKKNDNKRKNDVIEKLYKDKINDLKQKSIYNKKNGESYKEEYEQIKKHIKEMREVSLKKEMRNNSIVAIISISLVCIVLFVGIGSIRYAVNSKKQNTVKVASSAKNESNGDKKQAESISKNNDSDDKSSKQKQDQKTEKDKDIQKDENDKANQESAINQKIYTYLSKEDNRKQILDQSMAQNNNKTSGLNVILLKNILSKNGVDVAKSVINNVGLKTQLTKLGFKSYTNPNQLQKGDIVFTVDVKDAPGVPSHVYIFMGWADNNKRVGYVVDGLVKVYRNTYHKRAITVHSPTTDKMKFFMRK